MDMEFTVTFTAEEVNRRILTEGTPPITKFIKRTKEMNDGKESYSHLLCQRLSAIFPQRPAFSIRSTLKSAARGATTVCYAHCTHDTSNTVSFTTADLKPDSGLNFKVKMNCHRCVKIGKECSMPSVSSTTSDVPSDVTASHVLVTPCAPNSVIDRYNRAALNLSKVLQNSLSTCLSIPEVPAQRQLLFNSQDQIEQKLINAWREAMIGIEPEGPVEPETMIGYEFKDLVESSENELDPEVC